MPGGGLFTVAWGLFATGFGTIVATDFRGAAHRLHEMAERRPLGGSPGVGFQRAIAGVFALVGPVMLVSGVVDLLRSRSPVGAMPRLPLPFLAVAGLVVAFTLWSMWWRRGPLRHAWAGGGLRRAAAVLMTLTFFGFAAGLGLGQ